METFSSNRPGRHDRYRECLSESFRNDTKSPPLLLVLRVAERTARDEHTGEQAFPTLALRSATRINVLGQIVVWASPVDPNGMGDAAFLLTPVYKRQ